MPDAAPSTAFASALVASLVDRGVQHFVLSPGSRSQALALVLAQWAEAGRLTLTVRLDERVAGFVALGAAIESGRPTAVVTTSGSAVANLHPAVLEAHHSRVPLILLTADRPAELRGIRSNQTTHQGSLFGPALRALAEVDADEAVADGAQWAAWAVEAAAPAVPGAPGPVQLNIGFREPLSGPLPELPERVKATERANPAALADDAEAPLLLPYGVGTVVIAGHGAGPDAEKLARAGGWPLLAEVSSGSRFGPHLVAAYRELLDEPGFGDAVERAVVFGQPTLSREVPALLARDGVEVIVVQPRGDEWYDTSARKAVRVREVTVVTDSAPSRDDRAWLGRWVQAGRTLLDMLSAEPEAPKIEDLRNRVIGSRREFAKSELAVLREPVTREILAAAVWRATWPHDRLVLAASRLIRVVDRIAPGKKITVHANRGLAGIDGTVSTAVGIAVAGQTAMGEDTPPTAPGVTRVLIGDLALLHDVGGLLFGDGEQRPKLQVIVGNDHGGTIFEGLEVAATADPDAMRRVMLTPQRVDLSALANAYGWEYRTAATRSELDQALTAPVSGPMLVEVPLA